jgi:hypothetical protein
MGFDIAVFPFLFLSLVSSMITTSPLISQFPVRQDEAAQNFFDVFIPWYSLHSNVAAKPNGIRTVVYRLIPILFYRIAVISYVK